MGKRPSQGKILQDVTAILGVEDYVQVPLIVQRLMDAARIGAQAICVIWNPALGQQPRVMEMLPEASAAYAEAAMMLRLGAEQLNRKALELAKKEGVAGSRGEGEEREDETDG